MMESTICRIFPRAGFSRKLLKNRIVEHLSKYRYIFSCLALSIMILCLLPGCGSSNRDLTVLSSLNGDVSVYPSGKKDPVSGQVGMKLKTGDIIKTGNEANAAVTFFEGSVIDIKPGTMIEITHNFDPSRFVWLWAKYVWVDQDLKFQMIGRR